MKGQGAMVFLLAFFVMFLATLASPEIPIGRMLYRFLGVPDSDYPVLGTPATTLIIAAFNGVFYGIIAWVIFTFAMRLRRPSMPRPAVPS